MDQHDTGRSGPTDPTRCDQVRPLPGAIAIAACRHRQHGAVVLIRQGYFGVGLVDVVCKASRSDYSRYRDLADHVRLAVASHGYIEINCDAF